MSADQNQMDRHYRRIRMLVAPTKILATDDSGSIHRVQVNVNGSPEMIDQLPVMQFYGLNAHAPIGSDATALFIAGDRSNGVILGTNNQKARLRNLKPGEVSLYTDEGDHLLFGRNQATALNVGNSIALSTKAATIKGSNTVTLDSPVASVTDKLVLAHDPQAPMEACTKQYADSLAMGGGGGEGPPGPPGTAATIAVGTTTTGAPGSNASVINVGTSAAAIFDFMIPRGDVGATGPPGPAASYQAGPGLSINSGTTPPTIDVATPYLPLTGGLLSGTLFIKSTPGLPQPASGAIALHAANETGGANILMDCYGAAGTPNFGGRKARGTAAAPSALLANDILVSLNGEGRGATSYSVTAPPASITITTAENWTDTAQGTRISFYTTPVGTTTRAAGMTLNPSGGLTIGGAPDPGINSMALLGLLTLGPQAALAIPPYPNVWLHQLSDSGTNIQLDGSAGGSNLIIRRANTSLAAPSALHSGDIIGGIQSFGYGATKYSLAAVGRLAFVAAENWTDTANGTQAVFYVTPNGSSTSAIALTVMPSGGLAIGSAADPGINSMALPGHIIAGAPTAPAGGYLAGDINAQRLLVNGAAPSAGAGGAAGQVQFNSSGVLGGFTVSGDATLNTASGLLTFAAVNSNVGTFQGLTLDAKGRITAAVNMAYAPLASPALTGTPTAPTATAGTNTTQLATTAFVLGQGFVTGGPYAPLASPTFTGAVTAPVMTITGNGITYPTAGGHSIGFGWNGTQLTASVDGTGNPGAVAIVAGAAGQIQYSNGSHGLAATDWTTGLGLLQGNNTTSNLIQFGTAGIAAPTVNTRSAGTKIVLYNSLSPSGCDYALGIQNGSMWLSAAAFAFYSTSAAQIATLSSAGALTVSGGLTVSGNVAIPTGYLYLGQSAANTSVMVIYRQDGGLGQYFQIFHSAANLYFYNNAGNVNAMQVDYQGNFTVAVQGFKPGGGSWAATSDSRLKRDIEPYTQGLAAVLALNPIVYSYNGLGETRDDGTRYVGLDAARVELVMPELVGRKMIKLHPTPRDPAGPAATPPAEDPDTEILTLDPSALLYALVNSCKELVARNDALETRLAAIEGRLQ